jgi:hypothetical protein
MGEPLDETPPGEQPDKLTAPDTPIAPNTPTTTEPSKQAGLGTRNHLQFMSS